MIVWTAALVAVLYALAWLDEHGFFADPYPRLIWVDHSVRIAPWQVGRPVRGWN